MVKCPECGSTWVWRQDGGDQTLCESNPSHRVRFAEIPRKPSFIKPISRTQEPVEANKTPSRNLLEGPYACIRCKVPPVPAIYEHTFFP